MAIPNPSGNIKQREHKPRSRKKRILLQLLITAAGMLLLFLFWLLYPVKPSASALRGSLPKDCIASLETHLPLQLWQQYNENGYFEKLPHLPAWPLIQKQLARSTGHSIGEKEITNFVRQINTAVEKIPFGNSLLSLAAGICADQKNFAAVAEIDNLGVAAFTLWLKFSPSGKINGNSYIELKTGNRAVGSIYLTLLKSGRLVAAASSLELLKQIDGKNRQTILKTWYSKDRQTPLELSLHISLPDDFPKTPRRIILPNRMALSPRRFRCELLIDFEKFYLESITGFTPLTPVTLQYAQIPLPLAPEGMRGLFLGITGDDRTLRELLHPLTGRAYPDTTGLFIRNSLLKEYSGSSFFIFRQPPQDQAKLPQTPDDTLKLLDYSALGWSVKDGNKAFEQFSIGIKKLLENIKEENRNDPMASFLLSQLLISNYHNGNMLILPQDNPSINPFWKIYSPAGKPQSLVISSAAATPQLPQSNPQSMPTNLYGQSQLYWKHSPLTLMGIEQLNQQLHEIQSMLSPMLQPQDSEIFTNIRDTLKTIKLICSGLKHFNTTLSISGDQNQLLLEAVSYGELLLPPASASRQTE